MDIQSIKKIVDNMDVDSIKELSDYIKELSDYIKSKIIDIQKEELLLTAKFKKGDILIDQYGVPMEVNGIKVLDMTDYFLTQYYGNRLTKNLKYRKDERISSILENRVCGSIIDGIKTIYQDNINRIHEGRGGSF